MPYQLPKLWKFLIWRNSSWPSRLSSDLHSCSNTCHPHTPLQQGNHMPPPQLKEQVNKMLIFFKEEAWQCQNYWLPTLFSSPALGTAHWWTFITNENQAVISQWWQNWAYRYACFRSMISFKGPHGVCGFHFIKHTCISYTSSLFSL